MTVTIQLSSLLRAYCGGTSDFKIDAPTVGAALAEMERTHPALYRSVCDETGAVRRHVNVFVNTRSIRDGEKLETRLTPGDVVTIIQAVSGG